LIVGGLCVAGLVAAVSMSLPESAPARAGGAEASPAFARAEAKYYGSDSCRVCHLKPDHVAFPDPLCQLTEYTTWQEHDKHSQAYAVLEQERAQQMGRLLGIEVTNDERCLNCHAMNIPEARRGVQFKLTDGVSCDGCHGPAQLWYGDHSQKDIWRSKSPEQKADLGMLDIRDPVVRSTLCTSCHIGNTEQKKVLTHAMYAAGHPPLPGIEIATFSDALPRHWQLLRNKSPEVRQLFRYDPAAREQTKLVVVSSAVTLRQALTFLASQAALCERAEEPDQRVLDLAHFNCHACHHDLQTPGWRQGRGYQGKPGRPRMRSWPTALVQLGLRQISNEHPVAFEQRTKELQRGLRELQEAFTARPFGNPRDIGTAAQKLAQWLELLIPQIVVSRYDQAAAQRLLVELCSPPKGDQVDYDSARQIAWAFQIVYSELSPKPTTDAQIRKVLSQLDADLKLSLPSGKGRQIRDELPLTFQRISAYNPDRRNPPGFKQRLDELSRLLPR
jgi:hypothetical protein